LVKRSQSLRDVYFNFQSKTGWLLFIYRNLPVNKINKTSVTSVSRVNEVNGREIELLVLYISLTPHGKGRECRICKVWEQRKRESDIKIIGELLVN